MPTEVRMQSHNIGALGQTGKAEFAICVGSTNWLFVQVLPSPGVAKAEDFQGISQRIKQR